MAHKALGIDLFLRQERVFLNRFGQHIYEDILHFAPSSYVANDTFLDDARAVAKLALSAAHLNAPDDAKPDLELALANIDSISPSLMFNNTPSNGETNKNNTDSPSPEEQYV